jgi:hypothetical protein
MGGYAEILIAFAMVALLGLILRFTFGRELPRGAGGARFAQRDDDGTYDLDENAYMVVSENPTPPTAAPASGDDFGLLAPVAVTADEEQAKQLKLRLGEAHIRATTTRGRDGRYRVLVFATELDQARRVTGGTS